MRRYESVYLHHILDAIDKIEAYLEGIDETAFSQQSLVQDGVIRQLEIIGEAVKRVPGDLRSQQPHVSWQDIAGMRDKLIPRLFWSGSGEGMADNSRRSSGPQVCGHRAT